MTTLDGISISIDGSYREFSCEGSEYDRLKALQGEIGGYIEAVISENRQYTVWFDEEGGPEIKARPVNPLGSLIYWQLCQMRRSRPLYGTVVITGGPDKHGGTKCLTDEQRAVLVTALDKAAARQ